MAELREQLDDDAVVVSDGGNFYGWIARHFQFRAPFSYLGPASGAMGYGLPAAIGGKLAHPHRQVVSVAGDGGFMMSLQELETAVRLGVPVVQLVLDNARYGTIRMHQERHHPGRVVGTELTTSDAAAIARGFGAAGWTVRENGEFGPALREALKADRPALIHVLMDREQMSVESRIAAEERVSSVPGE
jgi:acetolactate synthase-1/2/3 large subunit